MPRGAQFRQVAALSKEGYFPGSKNGGAELHSVIAKFGTGVQVAAVVNGDLNFGGDDVMDAYNTAWQAV